MTHMWTCIDAWYSQHEIESLREPVVKKTIPLAPEYQVHSLPRFNQLCNSVYSEAPCTYRKCAFAHNIHQFQPDVCPRGDACTRVKGKQCRYRHANENSRQYFQRLQLVHLLGKHPRRVSISVALDRLEPSVRELRERGFTDFQIRITQ